jgi:hypothetical protein
VKYKSPYGLNYSYRFNSVVSRRFSDRRLRIRLRVARIDRDYSHHSFGSVFARSPALSRQARKKAKRSSGRKPSNRYFFGESSLNYLQGATTAAHILLLPVNIASITHPASDTIHLECLGRAEAPNRIESSSDLRNFTTLATKADKKGAFQYDDTDAGTKKFYRARYP